MAKYAEQTRVSSAASRDEIERTLQRYGADQFIYGWDGSVALIGFRMHGRQVRYSLTMPDRWSEAFTLTPSRKRERDEKDAQAEWEKACRQRWRALALVVKAKLEAIDAGITSFEDEFLSATMLPDGSTVGQWAAEQVKRVYQTGEMPPLLPGAQKALREASRER